MLDRQSPMKKFGTYLVSFLIILCYCFPLYILINISLRYPTDFSSRLAPTQVIDWSHYTTIVGDRYFWNSMKNTVLYALMEMAILIPIGSLGGYGLARSKGWLTNTVRNLNVMVMMIPGTALLVGTYSLMVKLKLTNSLFGLALLGAGGGMTGCMFFYTTFCTSIPVDLDEAASIDGAGVIRTFFTIIFPQMKAITVTRLIGVLTGAWNNYLMPMYLLTKQERFTVLLFVRKLFTSSNGNTVPIAFAGCTLMVIPILIFYFLMQKQIIGGQLDSAVKG